ncbi:hypothetical protein RJ639_011696 [Escallonia herrerae]|uniref:PPM-type phosphatase domain-containing protein n=1 Tax=Escallonia herrerae TaxID=1293975 RepID=A0AA88VPD9_9ASTE|nr:hypothetical protein RJ639_011696 [Escallonia herrerae]
MPPRRSNRNANEPHGPPTNDGVAEAIIHGFQNLVNLIAGGNGVPLHQNQNNGPNDGVKTGDILFAFISKLHSPVFVANIGDAKAVLARSLSADDLKNNPSGVSPLKAIVLTREHKAIYPQERERIQKAGGSVSSNGRLQGRLEVSRAFGDRQFKKGGVVATPDIHSFDLTERHHFIILGCDGLWEVFGPSDAVEFVHKLLNEGLPVAAVSRLLVREAVRERLCKDNCTAIVIFFRKRLSKPAQT